VGSALFGRARPPQGMSPPPETSGHQEPEGGRNGTLSRRPEPPSEDLGGGQEPDARSAAGICSSVAAACRMMLAAACDKGHTLACCLPPGAAMPCPGTRALSRARLRPTCPVGGTDRTMNRRSARSTGVPAFGRNDLNRDLPPDGQRLRLPSETYDVLIGTLRY
jgi:hypothetical protein